MGWVARRAVRGKALREPLGAACVLVAAFALLPGICRAETPWLLDLQRFRASVHGDLSCLDCHEDVAREKSHPSSENVNRDPRERFQADRCGGCHADAVSGAREGEHGGVALETGQSFLACLDCHDPHGEGTAAAQAGRSPESPAAGEGRETACLSCHSVPRPGEPDGPEGIAALCLCCHGGAEEGQEAAGARASRCVAQDRAAWTGLTHAKLACTACHQAAAAYPHSAQTLADCRSCHAPHDESVARHVHARVSCAACHMARGGIPVREEKTGRILWERRPETGPSASIHRMQWPGGTEPCRRCHVAGNRLGAAGQVLPAKGLVCAPCHVVTLSVSDWPSAAGLGLFGLGVLCLFPVWFEGRPKARGKAMPGGVQDLARTTAKVISFVRSLPALASALVLDGLLQRRLYQASKARWAAHGLIFFSFLLRFLWGAAGLAASLWAPASAGTLVLLDRDHPVNAFLFDATGLAVLGGAALLVFLRFRARRRPELAGLPPPDRPAYFLLGAVFCFGFVLEGARIALAGSPAGSEWSFAGRLLSLPLASVDWTEAYGLLWTVHALLVSAFAAYLPFSRMLHVFAAPLALALRAAGGYSSKEKSPSCRSR